MKSIFDYRELIWNFIKRDISSKYVGSLLGLYWSILNPIIFLVVYITVFGVFLNVRLPGTTSIWDFALYFASGFLPWLAFQDSVIRASRSIIDNKNYIKKVPFPSEIFPVYTTLSEFVNLLIGLAIYLFLFIFLKGTLTVYIFLLPLAILLQIVFTLSLAFFLSSGAVYFRDIPTMLGPLFMIWFWVTPIAYTVNLIPANFQWIVKLNPAYYMIEIYRDALFYGRMPEINILLPFLIFSIVMFVISIWFFRKIKTGFGELL
jgi:ABC-type polysaccharide/polyol phosphate export permease